LADHIWDYGPAHLERRCQSPRRVTAHALSSVGWWKRPAGQSSMFVLGSMNPRVSLSVETRNTAGAAKPLLGRTAYQSTKATVPGNRVGIGRAERVSCAAVERRASTPAAFWAIVSEEKRSASLPLHAPPPVHQRRVLRHFVERHRPPDLRVAAGEEEAEGFAAADRDLGVERAPELGPAGATQRVRSAGEVVAGGEPHVGGELAEALDRDHLELRAGVRRFVADRVVTPSPPLSRRTREGRAEYRFRPRSEACGRRRGGGRRRRGRLGFGRRPG
jgi:hypothetical protein